MTQNEIFISDKTLKYRKIKSNLVLTFCVIASILTVLPLLYIFFYTTASGFSHLSLDFLIQMPKPVGEEGGGMANAIVGTLILIGLASAIGIPVGILSGIYVAEYSGGIFSNIVKFVTDVLSGTPSIIIGIFAYTVIVLTTGSFSALSGGFALGIIMIPTVTRITEEMLKLVPQSIREASLALGISRWRTTLNIVLKTALPGITTGILLAIARIAGETAPLLFTSFGNQFFSLALNEPIASLPIQIYNYAKSPYTDWHQQAWAGAMVLVMLVFVINLIVRFFTKNKFSSEL